MRREEEPKQSSFADEARAMQAVPQEHLLLRMGRAIQWAAVEKQLEGYYDHWVGRPAWPPAVLLRMLLLEQYAKLSDRQVIEQTGYNLLYRRFVGLGVDEAVPDDTTLVRFRQRVGQEGIQRVFELLNAQWAEAGLIGEQRRVLDGVHLWANVAQRSLAALLRKGRQVLLEALEGVDAAQADELRKQYAAEAETPMGSKEEVVAEEAERTRALVEAVEKLGAQAVQARVAQVKTLLTGEADRVVSFDDPDARWGHKSQDKVFCGYKAHEALDPDSRLITGVTVVAGNEHEGVQTEALLKAQSPALPEGATIIADGFYNNATTVGQVQEAGMQPCFAGLEAERVSDKFDYQGEQDRMVCEAGKQSVGKTRLDQGDLYYFSMKDCNSCALRDRCLSPGEREGKAQPRRRVYLSDVRKAKLLAGEAGKQWRKEQLKVRGRIEAKFSEQMNQHGLRRARYWGLAKVTVQVLLNVIIVNLKRAVKLIRARAAPTPAATVMVSA
jgi:IS5 family transposase